MDEWGPRLRYAVMGLGLTPEAFWRLSLREWLMLTGSGESLALPRTELIALMQQFPDQET